MWCSSFENTHSHLCSALVEEREVTGEGGGSGFDLLVGFTFYLFGEFILRNILLGFPRINRCVVLVILFLSVILFICFCYENEMKY